MRSRRSFSTSATTTSSTGVTNSRSSSLMSARRMSGAAVHEGGPLCRQSTKDSGCFRQLKRREYITNSDRTSPLMVTKFLKES